MRHNVNFHGIYFKEKSKPVWANAKRRYAMNDMKQLVEKYKQELMEYSKRAVQEPPKATLEFPEMTVDDAEEPEETVSSEPLAEEPRIPRVISYGVDDVESAFDDIFGALTEDNGVSTVTPEMAEELDDMPESGESPDEQLGKRDFEEQEGTVNSPEDIQPLTQQGEAPIVPPERSYESLQEFTDVNERRGTARFRTYTARGALPVKGAKIVVSREIGGKRHVFYTLTTDESGLTPIISLPAPPKELSEAPDSPVTPYATYDAVITADGYDEVLIRSMPIFDGVQSLQRVALVPALGQPAEVIDNTEPDLNGGV